LAPIERKIYCYFSPNFSKYVSYRRAFDLYILEKRAHDNQVAEHEARIIRRQEAYWRSLSGLQFEREMGNLFHAMGYSVKHTPVTADGGVDLVLEKVGKRTVVQCKAHNKKISIEVARQLVASMLDFKAQSGIIACFDGATKPVVSYVAEREITILGIKDIVEITRRLQDSKTGHLN
jgi:restriction endonuclease Mrr